MKNSDILPRVIRVKNASGYLGMDKNRFNKEVRPYLTEVPIGKQGVGFDRLDLDAWFEHYKTRNGRPSNQRRLLWEEKERQVSFSAMASGTSKNNYSDSDFEEVLEQILSKKQKDI